MKKEKKITIRLNGEELDVLKRIRDSRGHRTMSDAAREAFRFVNVFFDERLTIKKAIKPSMLKLLIEDDKYRETVPIADILKTVPQLEAEIKKEKVKK